MPIHYRGQVARFPCHLQVGNVTNPDLVGFDPFGREGPLEEVQLHSLSLGVGLGLRHTRERLRELYGTDQQFALEPRPEGGMAAVIELPFHTASPTHSTPAPRRS